MRKDLDDILKWLLYELLDNRLDVCVINGLRHVNSTNCKWYQDLCNNHLRRRKRYPRMRTIIKRRDTITALNRMIAGNFKGVYAERILDIIEAMELPELKTDIEHDEEIP